MLNKRVDKYTIKWIDIWGNYQMCIIYFIPRVLFLTFVFEKASSSSHSGVTGLRYSGQCSWHVIPCFLKTSCSRSLSYAKIEES